MPVRNRSEVVAALKGGVSAGLIGGLVLTLLMVFVSLLAGADPWLSMKGAAIPFVGARAGRPGPDAIALLGLIVHLSVSASWGALFGLLVYGANRAATLAFGILWGFVVYLGMYFVVLPLVGLGAVASRSPAAPAIVQHLIFGLVVGAGFRSFQPRRPVSRDVPVQRPTRGGRDLEPPGPPPPA